MPRKRKPSPRKRKLSPAQLHRIELAAKLRQGRQVHMPKNPDDGIVIKGLIAKLERGEKITGREILELTQPQPPQYFWFGDEKVQDIVKAVELPVDVRSDALESSLNVWFGNYVECFYGTKEHRRQSAKKLRAIARHADELLRLTGNLRLRQELWFAANFHAEAVNGLTDLKATAEHLKHCPCRAQRPG